MKSTSSYLQYEMRLALDLMVKENGGPIDAPGCSPFRRGHIDAANADNFH